MTTLYRHHLGLSVRSPFRDALGVTVWFDRTSHYYSRSIAMTALHKPERTTYGQAIEAQQEFAVVICYYDPPAIECYGSGTFCCC